MTKRLPPRAVLFRRDAERARLELAAATFEVTAVFTRLAALATAGEMTTLIAPAKPYDLRETPAAAALLATLHEEGFRTAWEPISGLQGVPAHHGLRIDWSPAPLPIRG